MLLLSRLGICTYLGISFLLGKDLFVSTPASLKALPTRWELRQLDGQPVAAHLRHTNDYLLPSAIPGPQPDSGPYQLSFTSHLLSTAQLIVHMLEADNSKLGFGLHYLNVLQQINSYELVGNQLRLYASARTLPRLVFVAVPTSTTSQ